METSEVTSPHYVRRKLLKHKPAYIESVGMTDIATLSGVVDAPNGEGTVLRLVMGATEKMPFRALSYIHSALRVAQIIPFEQLQIVHANNLGHEVNGLRLEEVRRQSLVLAQMATLLISSVDPAMFGKVLHAEDTPIDLAPFIPLAKTALTSDVSLGDTLSRKGVRHNGEHVTYTAAHCAFQDTDRLTLQPILSQLTAPEQVRSERIVSIGCKQERTFYLARMAMRGLANDIGLVDSAQVFTQHVSPPYFMARDGEIALEDAVRYGFNIEMITDIAARRDINHLITTLNGEGN